MPVYQVLLGQFGEINIAGISFPSILQSSEGKSFTGGNAYICMKRDQGITRASTVKARRSLDLVKNLSSLLLNWDAMIYTSSVLHL